MSISLIFIIIMSIIIGLGCLATIIMGIKTKNLWGIGGGIAITIVYSLVTYTTVQDIHQNHIHEQQAAQSINQTLKYQAKLRQEDNHALTEMGQTVKNGNQWRYWMTKHQQIQNKINNLDN